MVINIVLEVCDMMGLVQDRFFFRCPFCSSMFASAREAELCCKRAKAQIACERLLRCNGIAFFGPEFNGGEAKD